jgi:RimJ/RimL family protein N-acetyltransferase
MWGFKHLNVDHLIAVIHPENLNSKSVLEKAGMHFVGRHNAYGGEVLKFEIKK